MAEELNRIVMPYHSDTVEFCEDRERFLVGTYELQDEDKVRRLGSLSVFRASHDSFEQISTIRTASGVLDVKFLPKGTDEFLVPMADGTVRWGRITTDNIIEFVSRSKAVPSDIALSVSCHDSQKISVAFSSGYLRQYQLTQDGMRNISSKKVHDAEAWAVLARGEQVFTGGDDSTLVCTDPSGSRALHVFEAGVTAIENDVQEHQILVGTYEDKLHQFDLRNVKKPTRETKLRGGVWRIKDNPWDSRFIAIAAMYAGALIFNRESWTEVSSYDGHESMCYGVAWKSLECAISCSFYDRVLAMWKTGLSVEDLT